MRQKVHFDAINLAYTCTLKCGFMLDLLLDSTAYIHIVVYRKPLAQHIVFFPWL